MTEITGMNNAATWAVSPIDKRTDETTLADFLADPGFGKYFTDYMAVADFEQGSGWKDFRITGTADWKMHPSAAVLHYGQEIFEGMKAYRHSDGSVWLFRPGENAKRFRDSAARMKMADFAEQDFLNAVASLISLEQRWVPGGNGDSDDERSLYIRPFMFASESLLGVREAHKYRFAVIATPAQPFYADPLNLWVSPNFSRSAMGGTGSAKCGGNYAASMAGEAEAHANGCNQVLWLDSASSTFVEECGTMNFLAITRDGQLITPELTGTILPGITRKSLLELAPRLGLTPVECAIDLADLRAQISEGYVVEALACGTAAVVSPVVSLAGPGWQVRIGDGTPGQLTAKLRKQLTDIQFGRGDGKQLGMDLGWMVQVA